MLAFLHIENVAVIEKVDIAFEAGFNVLTGETGAGKSIVIDAINMVLGERTSKDIIRKGQEKAYVCATFQDLTNDVLERFGLQGYCPDEDGNVLLEREISVSGRGMCKINGRPVSTSVLKGLTCSLINIHGQHDSQSLLQSESHIAFLDSFIGSAPLVQAYLPCCEALKEMDKQIKELSKNEMNKERRIDLLKYQIKEISKAQLEDGEEEELLARREVAANSEKIVEKVSESFALIYEGDEEFQSVHDLIAIALSNVRDIAQYDENLEKCEKTLQNISYEIEDVVEYLRDVKDGIDFSEEELDEIEQRLDVIKRLKRKYGADASAILLYLNAQVEELDKLENIQFNLQQLEAKREQLRKETATRAAKLYHFRLERKKELEEKIENELQFLNMENAKFSVSVEKHTDCEGNPIYRPTGCDEVEFLMKTNKGEDFKPLTKIASGGELSRIMLALKNIMTKGDSVGTLIFDEIDTGISGRAASKVAQKLKEIAGQKQVLCVSHLVTIAAKADHHYLIAKDASEHTKTTVVPLVGEQRVSELARLIGGDMVTETTMANARELLSAGV